MHESVSSRGARNAACIFVFILSALLIAAGIRPPAARAARANHAMVVAESELGARAGVEILKHGGNAVDAAVATALATCVTNPASCGIGGGGFMLIYMAKVHALYALDFRERAPLAATAKMFYRDGRPDEELARTGPLAVAVPGQVAGLEAALQRFGTMKFQAVAAPAIGLARDGFPVSRYLAWEIARVAPKIARDQGLRAVYLGSDGSALKQGDILKQPAMAATLELLRNDPVRNFYSGPIAHEIAAFIEKHGGIIGTKDLAAYRPIWRKPLHLPYLGYQVYAMPPPSSGGALLEMLGMLEPGDLPGLGLNSPPYLARLIEVMREGFIDRSQYADPAFVHVPIDMLLSPKHINQARDRALHHRDRGPADEAHDHGTSNLCVVDEAGNVVAATTTINTIFGAKMMIPDLGIVLNDEMDDFGVAPGVPNVYRLTGAKANEVAPGKRPLSSMTPIIVLKKGHPVLTVGGSGGPTIITGVLQVTLNVLDFHLDPERAVDEPRIHEQSSPPVVLAESAMPERTRRALEQMGYKLRVVPHLSAVGAITIAPDNLQGAFDLRKGGGAAGY
jgi:gamma-glutamyltranspeptidase / glutathione hydrolase